jgi:N-acetylmuramoyl-L-alanine amidase
MRDLEIDFVPSPNHSSRGGLEVVGTVIHYTADGPEWNPIRWLADAAARASAHFVIERDGQITRLVSLRRKAWHAGYSFADYKGSRRRDVSAFTIGVELANAGRLIKNGDRFYWQPGRGDPREFDGPTPIEASLVYPDGTEVVGHWEPFPNIQIDALAALLLKMQGMGYGRAAQNLIGHDEISGPDVRTDGRFKTDPGPLFPWQKFQRNPRPLTSRLAA